MPSRRWFLLFVVFWVILAILFGIAREVLAADPHPYCPGWPAGIEPQAAASSITFDPATGEYSEPVVTCLQRITVPVAADGR